MSISLHVEGYCQNCPNFEPVSYHELLETASKPIHIHVIYCEHRLVCAVLVDHLKNYPLLYKDMNIKKEKENE